MIWRDPHDRIEPARTCPVLALTPDVESALRWFDATYELTSDSGRVWWRRVALPMAGGAGEQDAWLLEALDLLRRVHDDLVNPPRKRTNDVG